METWPAGRPLKVWPRMQAITLEVVMRTVFGVTGTTRLRRLEAALRRCSRGAPIPAAWP